MDEVRRIRKERGWSQRKLAEESGVDKVTIVHIETGKTSPNVATLQKLAEALGCEMADFFPKVQARLPLEDRTVYIGAASGGASGASVDVEVLRRVLTLVSRQEMTVEEGMRRLAA